MTQESPASLTGSDPSKSASIAGLDIPDGYVPFTSRYGYRTHLDSWGRDAFSSRHTHGTDEDRYQWSHCERDQRFRCAWLPAALQEPFTAACKRGINPRTDCPVCEGNRITSEQKYRFDHDTKNFVPSCTEVSCHRCRWTWLVVDKRERVSSV